MQLVKNLWSPVSPSVSDNLALRLNDLTQTTPLSALQPSLSRWQ